jgi:hypothetical protein
LHQKSFSIDATLSLGYRRNMSLRYVSQGMARVSVLIVAAAAICGIVGAVTLSGNGPKASVPVKGSKVEVVKTAEGYQLLRNGSPYYIRGVGGNGSRKLLLEIGGNSFRTWGAENIGQVLDDAHKDGLTVTVGIWLMHAGEFNYSDPVAVKKQFEMCKEVVQKHKDHPALLMWAFGNEMEAHPDDPAVWRAVEDIAAMSKKIDPNHPTMTVIAEIGGYKVKNLHAICKSIDIVGINSYGGAPSLKERYPIAGGTKPYIITEFGAPGTWEVAKTKWEAPIEWTSTAKAGWYRDAYEKSIKGNPGVCLGSYAFLWGNKQEGTATWFGMLLPDGSHTGAVDVMAELWTGKPRKNLVPKIEKLELSAADYLKPGQTIQATLVASDPEGKPLRVKWLLKGEVKVRLTAGRDEVVPPTYSEALITSTNSSAEFKVPKEGGAYRIFAYVYDDAGGAAVANVPIFIGE